jgi:hypothetical protein
MGDAISTVTTTTPVAADPALAEKAAAIRELARSTRENIIEIGRHLIEARDGAGHGAWLTWIHTEFGWSDQTAYRFIHVYELSRDAKFHTLVELDLPLGVLYQLAAPRAEGARQEIVERIESGESISQETVIEVITDRRKSSAKSNPAESHNAGAENDDAFASAEARKVAYAASEPADGAVEHGLDGDHDGVDRDDDHGGHDHDGCGSAGLLIEVCWEKMPEGRQRIRDLVLEEYFAATDGADILARIPVARRDEVVAAFLVKLTVKDVIAVFGDQLRAELPANPLLKLREMDNVSAAETLLEAFGADRFETIVERVRELRAPKGKKSGKSEKRKFKSMSMEKTVDASGNPVFAQVRGNRLQH